MKKAAVLLVAGLVVCLALACGAQAQMAGGKAMMKDAGASTMPGGMPGCGCGMAQCGAGGSGCECGMAQCGMGEATVPGCGMMPRRGMIQRRGMMGRGVPGGMMLGRHHRLYRCMQNLGLSDKQREEIEGIRMATMKDVIHRKADMKIAQLELMDLLRKDHVDMKAVVAKVKKIEGLRADIHIALIKAREEVKAKLTPDQRQKMRDSMGRCFMMGSQWSGDTDEEMEMQTPMEKQDEDQPESEQMEEVH